MSTNDSQSRRKFVGRLIFAVALAPLATMPPRAHAADLPLLSTDDPAAKKVRYTEDASKENSITKDSTCGNCALYEGTYKSTRGPCQLFPGKHVKAAGWCSSWTPQI